MPLAQPTTRTLVLLAALLPLMGLHGFAHLRQGQMSRGITRAAVGLGDLVALVLFHSTGAAANLIFGEAEVVYLMIVGAGVGIYLWLWVEGIVSAVRRSSRAGSPKTDPEVAA